MTKRDMGDSTSNSKRIARIAQIEASSTSSPCKRTKIIRSMSSELENAGFLLKSPERAVHPVTSSGSSSFSVGGHGGDLCTSVCSDCSSNESCEIVKDRLRFVDLEAKSFGTEISTCVNNKFSRETTPTSEICREPEDMKSSPEPKKDHQDRLLANKMPSKSEIEKFFSEADKKEQKRFAEKYNYDIVKDAPLQGRYEWVRLKP